MPAWDEYKSIAKSRGALALELFVVESTPEKGPEALQANLPDHLAYQAKMEETGHLVLAGPLSDDTGEQINGAGMILYRAGDMDAARAIADADPMHATGTRSYRIRKWLINEGSLTISVGLSTGSANLS